MGTRIPTENYIPATTCCRSLTIFNLYNKIKHDIVLEEYVIQEKNFKNKQLIAKFRTSDHCLQIETGRYINIPGQQDFALLVIS